ncbi:MAG: hypothetical protein Q9183_004916, partial [Haloplaca sp. 2 TL-2023]
NAFVWALAYFIPPSTLYSIIKTVMQFPEHAARTATAFIKSPDGIERVLYLAKDELSMITDDKWGKEVWGAATEPGTNSKDTINSNLIFFWGQNDKWVARKTRDDLIAARGYVDAKESSSSFSSSTSTIAHIDPWKPSMYEDNQKIPHAFCLKHSELVAEKRGQMNSKCLYIFRTRRFATKYSLPAERETAAALQDSSNQGRKGVLHDA